MSSVKAIQLLNKVAVNHQKQKESFSKQEITQKINKLKYLSEQKKVSKMTIKKEIIHLEEQLKGVFELEKKLALEKKKESIQTESFKKQIENLKKKLAAGKTEELQQKVDRLSHLLGEYLSKSGVEKDVALNKKILTEIKRPKISKEEKISQLKSKLQQMRDLLVIKAQQNPEQAKLIQEKIEMIENKLGFTREIPIEEKIKAVKHDLMFPAMKCEPEVTDSELEMELPLPPPPRMARKI